MMEGDPSKVVSEELIVEENTSRSSDLSLGGFGAGEL